MKKKEDYVVVTSAPDEDRKKQGFVTTEKIGQNIAEMSNWDILTYLRVTRNWLVLSAFNREDYKELFGETYTAEEWSYFTKEMCDIWSDHYEYSTINGMLTILKG